MRIAPPTLRRSDRLSKLHRRRVRGLARHRRPPRARARTRRVGELRSYITTGQSEAVLYNQTRALDTQLAPKGQQVDLTFEFRWGFYPPDVGDPSPGGNSGRPAPPFSDLRRGSCVSGPFNGLDMTAPCFAQESGHNYGLEPATSPHYQDPNDNGHSKDPLIVDPYAFDFVKRVPYGTIGDTMNNGFPQGSWMGNDAVLYNAFDWEYLRQQFQAAKSSGATGTGKCGP